MYPQPCVPIALCSQSVTFPKSLCSHSPLFPKPYAPTALCSQAFCSKTLCFHSPLFPSLMFPHSYVPTALCFHSHMFPKPQYPHRHMIVYLYFPHRLVPTLMFPHSYVPKALCSLSLLFPHVPLALCIFQCISLYIISYFYTLACFTNEYKKRSAVRHILNIFCASFILTKIQSVPLKLQERRGSFKDCSCFKVLSSSSVSTRLLLSIL